MKRIVILLEKKTLIYALFGIYAAVVLRMTVLRPNLLPLHLFQGGYIDLLPIEYYGYWIKLNLTNFLIREVAGNIVGFLPLGGFLAWQNPKRPLWRVMLTGLCCSACIETAQYVLGVGTLCSGDLLTNTLGTLLGGALLRRMQAELP